MTIQRSYRLIAKADRSADLVQALRALAAKLAPTEGNRGIEVLEDLDKPGTYMFVEHWASIDAQKGAGALLGRAAFADIAPTLGAPPEVASLAIVDRWNMTGA